MAVECDRASDPAGHSESRCGSGLESALNVRFRATLTPLTGVRADPFSASSWSLEVTSPRQFGEV